VRRPRKLRAKAPPTEAKRRRMNFVLKRRRVKILPHPLYAREVQHHPFLFASPTKTPPALVVEQRRRREKAAKKARRRQWRS